MDRTFFCKGNDSVIVFKESNKKVTYMLSILSIFDIAITIYVIWKFLI